MFKFKVSLPKKIHFNHVEYDRDSFFQWVWDSFQSEGLQGIHEGTLLAQEASDQGIEAKEWIVDSAQASVERDWIDSQKEIVAEFYFSHYEGAEKSWMILKDYGFSQITSIEEQIQEDWDAQWKASFLSAKNGFVIPPFWKIQPAWLSEEPQVSHLENTHIIQINPGAGFGTGTHETTQLCLEQMGILHQSASFKDLKVLDFGSGSGILAIGAAHLGAEVTAIEIDPLALENALENAKLNHLENQISFKLKFSHEDERKSLQFDGIIANILKPVLLEFAEMLVSFLKPNGFLILSGLIDSDVEPVLKHYQEFLPFGEFEVFEKNEWRAIRMNRSQNLSTFDVNSALLRKDQIPRVEKPWGHELIWAKTKDYVGKVLHIKKGHKLSLQYHREKEETIYLSSGQMNLMFENNSGELETILMNPGDVHHIAVGKKHRMIAVEDCDVFEVSTPQLEDVVRLEDGYGRIPSENLTKK